MNSNLLGETELINTGANSVYTFTKNYKYVFAMCVGSQLYNETLTTGITATLAEGTIEQSAQNGTVNNSDCGFRSFSSVLLSNVKAGDTIKVTITGGNYTRMCYGVY